MLQNKNQSFCKKLRLCNIFFLISKNCIYQKPIRGRNQIHRGCITKNKGHNPAYKRERLDTKGTPKLTRSSPNKPPSSKNPKPNPIQPKNYTESIVPIDPDHAIDKLSLSFISVSHATFRASSSSSTFHPPSHAILFTIYKRADSNN
jgi:hypothetical protein